MTDPATTSTTPLRQMAGLLRARNAIDDVIAAITERPVTTGHLGDWIAAQIFDLELELSATATADGRFRSGPLAGKTVNVKWYAKQEGVLSMTAQASLDYPAPACMLSAPSSSRADAPATRWLHRITSRAGS